MTITIAPTTQAKVNTNATHGFSCYTYLADTEKIIIEVSEQVYDPQQKQYVLSTDKTKYQLEELHYHLGYRGNNDNDKEVSFSTAVVRGFRKDGALRYRTSYLPHHAHAEALAQIPDHYHDYARQAFQVEMAELQKKLAITISKGVVIK